MSFQDSIDDEESFTIKHSSRSCPEDICMTRLCFYLAMTIWIVVFAAVLKREKRPGAQKEKDLRAFVACWTVAVGIPLSLSFLNVILRFFEERRGKPKPLRTGGTQLEEDVANKSKKDWIKRMAWRAANFAWEVLNLIFFSVVFVWIVSHKFDEQISKGGPSKLEHHVHEHPF